jgi:hypothetical protein
MRAGVMNAAVFWRTRTAAEEVEQTELSSKDENVRPFVRWSPERFATEQIRTLVHRVFSPSVTPPVRQVVFSAVESETDAFDLCQRVGGVLAEETLGDVAVVGDRYRTHCERYEATTETFSDSHGTLNLREIATRVRGNLWTIPLGQSGKTASTASLHHYLGQIRREFEYSIIAAASCRESHEAISSAQFADGMILVLSAQFTRRIAAMRIRDAVEGARVRLLGTVLRDREFPIPEQLYRRL